MKYFVTVIATVMVIVGAYFAYKMGIAPLLVPNISAPAPLTKVVESPKPEKKYESYRVGKWSGQGIKSTETFHIPSNVWMIFWSSKPISSVGGILQIYVHRADGTLVDIAANIMGKNADNTIMRSGLGDYYLKINSANVAYGIVVTAARELP